MQPPESFVQFFLGFGPDATMLLAESHDPAEFLHACPSRAGKQQAIFSALFFFAVILGGHWIGSDIWKVDGVPDSFVDFEMLIMLETESYGSKVITSWMKMG